MRPARRVLTNTLWLGIEPALRLVIAVPLAGFTAHYLGVTGYGELNFAVAYAIVFGVVANLGLTEVLLRSVARHPPEVARLWWSTLALKGFLIVAYLLVLLGTALLAGYTRRSILLILMLGLYQGILSLDNTARGIFAGKQRMDAVASLSTGKTILEVLVTVPVLLLGADALGLAGSRVVIGMLGLVASIAITLKVLRIGWSRPSLSLASSLIGPGLGFAALNAIRSLDSRVGILILERMRGVNEVALYAAGYAIVDKIYTFLPALLYALFPFFSSIDPRDRESLGSALGRTLRYLGLIAFGLGLGTSVLGPWLLAFLFPAGFAATRPVLEVLGLAVALHCVNSLLISTAGACGHERWASVVAGGQCAAQIALALAFARNGALGLAVANVIAETFALLVLLAVYSRWVGLGSLSLGRLAGPALVAGVLLLAAVTLPGGRGLVLPVVLAAVYPLALLATPLVSAADREFLLSLLRRPQKA